MWTGERAPCAAGNMKAMPGTVASKPPREQSALSNLQLHHCPQQGQRENIPVQLGHQQQCWGLWLPTP